MKKIAMVATLLLLAACSAQPKNVYFNGSDGSHTGIKYDRVNGSLSVN